MRQEINNSAQDREQYKRIVTFTSAVLLMGLLTMLFAHIWYRYYLDELVLPFYRRGNWALIGVYGVVLFLFFKVYGGFKVGYLRRTDVMFSQVLAIIWTNVVSYFQLSLVLRHFAAMQPLLLLTAEELIVVVLWTILMQKLYFALYPPRRMIVVYGSKEAAALVLKMSCRVDKYMICESISADADLDTIRDKILQYDGVILQELPAELRNALVKFCFAHKLRAYVVPDIADIILRGAEDIRLFDTPLLLCRNYGLTFEQRAAKRLFDLLFCAVVSVPAILLMVVCAAAVKLCDGGTVFYRQKRLTYGGKEFNVCKFRSMIPDAEADTGAQLADDNDSRITPVGKVLRRFRLDELPQLINILKGDMSVVGPRPERPELCAEYEKTCPEFRFRLCVKAGLTGYAQVTGVYDTSPYDKLRMDLMYIENYSILKDIQIVFMTLKTMLFPNKKSNAALLHTESEKEEKR